jgi:hypothetical protein
MRMKEKTKKIIYRTVVFRLFGVAAVLVLAACTQPTDSGGANPLAGKGFVNINLDIGEDSSASVQKSVVQTDSAVPEASESPPEVLRTILPGSDSYSAFTSYKLIFTLSGSNPVTLDNLTSLSGIVLDAGAYSLDFTAYTGSGDAKVAAATGTVTGITVVEGNTANVTVELSFSAVTGETGTLALTVTNSSNLTLTEAKLAWTPLSTGGTAVGSETLSGSSLNKSLNAGYYLITVTLSNKELKTVRSDIAHIGAGLATKVAWAFAESDFSTIIKDIWLLGVHSDWTVYNTNNKLTEQTNGTFTWAGEMNQGYFRFSLEDTSGWGDDKLRPRRFQPASNRTVTSFGTPTDMTYVAANTGETTAWNLGGAGHYRFVVDPYVKTLTVTKPVIVESVAIEKEGGGEVTTISLPQGTTDYQFTAKVKGKNEESAQGVTWAISSGVATGTSIGQTDGKLTIDGAEAVTSTFTITATSVDDTSRSASVTVTVTIKPAPAPTNVALSDQGVATWDSVANVVSYTAQLYKDGSAEGAAITGISGTTHNFLSAMRAAGAGSYTVKVKSVGNGTNYSDSPEATSAAQSVSQRTAVEYTWWVTNTVAHWDTVSGSEKATDYTVNVYKGGTKVASTTGAYTYTESSKLKAYVDLTSNITTEGPGVYTFGVVTKGNNYLVLDAAETKLADASAYKHDVKLAAPTNPTWSGTSAQWDAVTNASGYLVQLYKDGSASGSPESASGTSYGSFSVSAAGLYTFTVKAIGTGAAGAGVYLDSDEATSSAKQVGGAASITLTPLEKQAGTLGVNGGGSASMVKNGGSLTINVTGSDFTTFVWIVDGVNQSETGSSITLSGADYKLGGHSVTVYALDIDGVPWSPAAPITFTVTAK